MATGTSLNGTLCDFIERQHIFFVATAADTGSVNLSPKGADSLRIIDNTHLLWLNLSGSGNETAGHLKIRNRITMMFCSFEGDPLILRLYGSARTIHSHDADWDEKLTHFPKMAGSRQVFEVTINSIQTSCGMGVPEMTYKEQRAPEQLVPYFDDMGPDGVEAYWRRKNVETIDGFDTGLFKD